MQNPAAAQVVIQQDPRFQKVLDVLQSDVPSNNFDFEEMMKNMSKGGNEPNFEEPPKQQYQPKPEPKK